LALFRVSPPRPGFCLTPIAGHNRFPFNNFRFFLLSFQSPFHLSLTVLVSYRSPRPYLALGGVYHPFQAALSSSPTLRRRPFAGVALCPMGRDQKRGFHPVSLTFSGELGPLLPCRPGALLKTTIPRCQAAGGVAPASRAAFLRDLRLGLFPVHSPLLRESLLFSFPPAR